MMDILAFYNVGETGFYLLVICLVLDIILYTLYRKAQQ